jgi:hypothetical protein
MSLAELAEIADFASAITRNPQNYLAASPSRPVAPSDKAGGTGERGLLPATSVPGLNVSIRPLLPAPSCVVGSELLIPGEWRL